MLICRMTTYRKPTLIMFHQTEPRDNLPLSETTFYILLTLAPAPKHGYAIKKEVNILSGKSIALSTGTLYGALKRLLEAGWIEPVAPSVRRNGARTRREYTLTPLGRSIFDAELARLSALTRIARSFIARGHV